MSLLARQLQLIGQDEGDIHAHMVSVLASDIGGDWVQASAQVKAHPLRPRDLPAAVRPRPRQVEETFAQTTWARRVGALMRSPDREEPASSVVAHPSLPDDFALLLWAGVGFSTQEVFRLHLSIKALAETLPADVVALRFFGRVSTRGKPYFVVEGHAPASEEQQVDPALQEGRLGLNKLAYWVSQTPETGEWIALPPVTCAQVVASRRFKHVLSGNLAAPVPAHPPFPGDERALLRALLARICGATSISPDGFFEESTIEVSGVDGETSEAVVLLAVEQTEDRAAGDLADMAAWRMHEREPNELGRVTAMPPLGEDEEPMESEAEVPAYLSELKENSWALRIRPDGAGASSSSVAIARSLEWPGAVAVAAGRRFVCVYVGSGLSFEGRGMQPSLPLPVAVEWRAEDPAEALLEEADPKVDPAAPEPEEAEAAEGEAEGEGEAAEAEETEEQ